jgi:hypothetical protein
MKEAEKNVREYLAKIGKRAALKAGKLWPPRDRKSFKLLKLS